MTFYAPRPPQIEKVDTVERYEALGFSPSYFTEGNVVAVNVSADPPQVEGVYTPAEFDTRYTPTGEPTA